MSNKGITYDPRDFSFAEDTMIIEMGVANRKNNDPIRYINLLNVVTGSVLIIGYKSQPEKTM